MDSSIPPLPRVSGTQKQKSLSIRIGPWRGLRAYRLSLTIFQPSERKARADSDSVPYQHCPETAANSSAASYCGCEGAHHCWAVVCC